MFTGVNESTEIWSSRETIVESHAGWYTCCFSMEFSFFIALSDSPLLVEVLGLVGITHQKLNIEIPGSAHFDILLESGFLDKNSPRSRRIMSIRFFFWDLCRNIGNFATYLHKKKYLHILHNDSL